MKLLGNAASASPAGCLVRFLRADHCYRSSRYFLAAIPSFLFTRYPASNGASALFVQMQALGTLALSVPSVADDLWTTLLLFIWQHATEPERTELLAALCDCILRHTVKHRGTYWISDFDTATASTRSSSSSAGPVKSVQAALLRADRQRPDGRANVALLWAHATVRRDIHPGTGPERPALAAGIQADIHP